MLHADLFKVRLHKMLVLTAVLACLTMTACQSFVAPQQEVAAVDSVVQLRANLVAARAQAKDNMDAANALPDSSEKVAAAFVTYQRKTDRTRHAAESAGKRSASLQVNGPASMRLWELEMAKLSNPKLRVASAEHTAIVRRHYDKIRDQAADTQAAYAPFVSDLTDLEVYLQQDTTMRGVNAALPKIAKIENSGNALRSSIDAFIAAIDALTADATRTTPIKE